MGKLWQRIEQGAVDIILLVVGGIATYLSVKYTWQWQTYTGDNVVEGLAYSLVIVGFATLVFEFAVQAAREKKKWAWALFLGWLVVTSYSMQTTVAGQWIGVRSKEVERASSTQQVVQAELEAQALDEEIRLLEGQLDKGNNRRIVVERLLAGVDTVEKRQEFRRNSAELEKELKEITTAQEEIGKRIVEARMERARRVATVRVAEVTGAGNNVFAFYEEVLKVDSKRIEFVLAVFKGIILDTVNILCFMFVMIRRTKKGENVVMLQTVPEDESPPERRKRHALSIGEVMANEMWREGRKGRRWLGKERAKELGIPTHQYGEVVQALVRTGTIVRRGRSVKLNEWVTKEELICEIEKLGLTVGS